MDTWTHPSSGATSFTRVQDGYIYCSNVFSHVYHNLLLIQTACVPTWLSALSADSAGPDTAPLCVPQNASRLVRSPAKSPQSSVDEQPCLIKMTEFNFSVRQKICYWIQNAKILKYLASSYKHRHLHLASALNPFGIRRYTKAHINKLIFLLIALRNRNQHLQCSKASWVFFFFNYRSFGK